MPKLEFNKLVRDKVPNKIIKNGEYAFTEILNDRDFELALNNKLLEELKEVINSDTKEDLTEELADLLEVMLAKASLYGISYDNIEDARNVKAQTKGAFNNKVFLKYTVDKNYIDLNKGCQTCVNDCCTLPLEEMNEDSKCCINYKNPLNKK